ncbi:hypothetical protein RchiOBHm_Chr3g0491301 [Rosa chinensis]|uniref:Uncharacterized protein n=1 Tax=Rosa chinensis TaxID=74649 RepID=A0A2P6RG71_ROSCH|nr:hypothetical protein RchiOBHm_Chr3g0491301 [Rosa chinensis]
MRFIFCGYCLLCSFDVLLLFSLHHLVLQIGIRARFSKDTKPFSTFISICSFCTLSKGSLVGCSTSLLLN